ncbi:MAG TPA: cell division FtsA domain-containing protein, partial [Candidatus Dojkabacteria bacterium]|nr:cell division FtsA domain-containing protein [Candidatus Dojkabacteria bacterium]
MKLPNIFQKSNLPNNITNGIALDIGTEVLKTILFDTNEKGVVVKKVARIQQQQNAMQSGIIKNLNTVLENCRLALSEITNGVDITEPPKYTVMGIAGEAVQGVSIVVNYEREEKFDMDVTEKEQKEIIQRVHKQILENGKEDLAKRIGLVSEDIEILHITVTGMEIGGMNVNNLIGFRGKNVKLNFYASFAPKTYTEALHNVASSLKLEIIGIVSQPFAVARGFVGATDKDFSGIFVDIGGGTTDVAIVSKGSVIDTQMFAFGGRVFTKELAKALNLDYRHAELRKIKYSMGELDDRLGNQVKKVVYPIAQVWMKTLKSALDLNHDLDVLPNKIYLCGGGSLLPEIKE